MRRKKVVLVMGISCFPAAKSAELGKKYLEVLKKYPPDDLIYKIITWGAKITLDGMKAFTIFEVKEGKFNEFMKLIYEQILLYSEIEGYRSDVEVFMSGTEAYPLIGLEIPEQ